ncbi:MAG: endonuclease domain-containing protein [Myxococcota bacterium]
MFDWRVSTASLLDTHRRIREAGPLVSVVAGHRRRDARTTVAVWAADERPFVCPQPTYHAVECAWRARGEKDNIVLFLSVELHETWSEARAFAEAHPRVDVVVASQVHDVVETLLDPRLDPEFVMGLMQGLVPVEEQDGQLIREVAEDPRLRPFVRSPYEGLLYFMLEARSETCGQFQTNQHIRGPSGQSWEVDIVDRDRLLIVEIDGGQHESPEQQRRDERKEADLGAMGFAFVRATHTDVAKNPVGVWERVHEMAKHLDMKKNNW